MTKINNTGIISKKIVTDNLYNTQGDKYLTDADLGGVSGNFQEILDNAVQQATEDAKEAKVLAETAAINALESERNVAVRAEEIISQVTLEAEEIISQVTLEAEEIISQVTSEAKEAKVLAETAAVNALESERNVTNLTENLSEHISKLAQSDFVIETWRDGYNWYRLYQSGWIEQGGSGGQASTTYKVILHKEMADNLYHVNLTSYDLNSVSYNIVCNNRTTTDFEIYEGGDGAKVATKMWEVKGFIKQN